MLTQFAVVVTWVFVIASVIQAWRMYRFLPARIPVHFVFAVSRMAGASAE